MTLDEAIKHSEEIAEMYDDRRFYVDNRPIEVKELDYALGEAYEKAGVPREEIDIFNPERCANEHRQLAQWLRELQELKEKHWDECRQIAHYDDELHQTIKRAIINNGRAVLTNMDNLDLQDENRELKKLLTIAMADLAEAEDCTCCIFDSKQCPGVTGDCTFKWKHHDEAIELMGGENI